MNRCFLYSKKLALNVLAFIFCLIQIVATAQTTNEVKGQVNDENGVPINGAIIVAKNLKQVFLQVQVLILMGFSSL